MNYTKIYDNIIERAKNRTLEGYVEKHHIIPKCMGGTDDPENISILTAEEHFLCHQLLIKIHPFHYGIIKAAHMMCVNVEYGRGEHHRLSNKLYGWIKKKQYLRIDCVCEYCGKITKRRPSQMRKFCNSKCMAASKQVEHICKYCNKIFHKAKSYSTVYCSEECRKSFKKRPTTGECKNCNKVYELKNRYKPLYCSHECFIEYEHLSKRVEKKCDHCNTTFFVSPNKNPRFCNAKCQKDFYRIKSQPVWINCPNCDKLFDSYNAQRNRKFCSKLCFKKFGSRKSLKMITLDPNIKDEIT